MENAAVLACLGILGAFGPKMIKSWINAFMSPEQKAACDLWLRKQCQGWAIACADKLEHFGPKAEKEIGKNALSVGIVIGSPIVFWVISHHSHEDASSQMVGLVAVILFVWHFTRGIKTVLRAMGPIMVLTMAWPALHFIGNKGQGAFAVAKTIAITCYVAVCMSFSVLWF